MDLLAGTFRNDLIFRSLRQLLGSLVCFLNPRPLLNDSLHLGHLYLPVCTFLCWSRYPLFLNCFWHILHVCSVAVSVVLIHFDIGLGFIVSFGETDDKGVCLAGTVATPAKWCRSKSDPDDKIFSSFCLGGIVATLAKC